MGILWSQVQSRGREEALRLPHGSLVNSAYVLVYVHFIFMTARDTVMKTSCLPASRHSPIPFCPHVTDEGAEAEGVSVGRQIQGLEFKFKG